MCENLLSALGRKSIQPAVAEITWRMGGFALLRRFRAQRNYLSIPGRFPGLASFAPLASMRVCRQGYSIFARRDIRSRQHYQSAGDRIAADVHVHIVYLREICGGQYLLGCAASDKLPLFDD